MGGMVVQQMAAMQNERVSKLICYGTGPVGVLPDRFETLDQVYYESIKLPEAA